MSAEYIKKIIIKDDGVYLYSKANNDDLPYKLWRCTGLSDIYRAEGQRGLDKEVIKMFRSYATPKGEHPSIAPYIFATKSPEAIKLITRRAQGLNGVFSSLCVVDKECIDRWPLLKDEERTAVARAYMELSAATETELCVILGHLAQEYRERRKEHE